MNTTKILGKVCVFLLIQFQGVIIFSNKVLFICYEHYQETGFILKFVLPNNLQEDNFMFITETKVKDFALYEYSGQICILNL